jgi:hypothetical protein
MDASARSHVSESLYMDSGRIDGLVSAAGALLAHCIPYNARSPHHGMDVIDDSDCRARPELCNLARDVSAALVIATVLHPLPSFLG